MKTYKVWIHVEEHDDEVEEYRDVTEPEDIGEYTTLGAAASLVARLQEVGVEEVRGEIKAKAQRTVEMIRAFDRQCVEAEYTDTGKAWRVMWTVRDLWTPLLQEDEKVEIEPSSPQMEPEDAPGDAS